MKLLKKEMFENRTILTILGFIKIKWKNRQKYFCPICGKTSIFLPFGEIRRENALCPICNSLERDRFSYFIYKKFFLDTEKNIKILHMAPEEYLYYLITKNKNIDYLTMDICPDTYTYAKNCQYQNACDMTFDDNSFDIIISNQVIEHVDDDKALIKECLRVLKPGGSLFLNFPYKNIEKTFEDKSITTPEERSKYYGQSDHVRLYGKDFLKHLDFVSCKVEQLEEKKCFIKSDLDKMQLIAGSDNKNGGTAHLRITKEA